MILLIGFLVILQKGNALNCFKCSSKESRSCEKTQIVEKCKETFSMCYTMIQKSNVKETPTRSRTMYGIQKGCGTANVDCDTYCQAYRLLDYACKVSCCADDLCNNDSSELKERGFLNKIKRSSKSEARNSSLRPIVPLTIIYHLLYCSYIYMYLS